MKLENYNRASQIHSDIAAIKKDISILDDPAMLITFESGNAHSRSSIKTVSFPLHHVTGDTEADELVRQSFLSIKDKIRDIWQVQIDNLAKELEAL